MKNKYNNYITQALTAELPQFYACFAVFPLYSGATVFILLLSYIMFYAFTVKIIRRRGKVFEYFYSNIIKSSAVLILP